MNLCRFDIGEVANLSEEGMKAYELSLKQKRDAESIYLTATRIGLEKGREEGEHKKALAIALKLKNMGIPIEQIVEGTGLTVEEIEKL